MNITYRKLHALILKVNTFTRDMHVSITHDSKQFKLNLETICTVHACETKDNFEVKFREKLEDVRTSATGRIEDVIALTECVNYMRELVSEFNNSRSVAYDGAYITINHLITRHASAKRNVHLIDDLIDAISPSVGSGTQYDELLNVANHRRKMMSVTADTTSDFSIGIPKYTPELVKHYTTVLQQLRATEETIHDLLIQTNISHSTELPAELVETLRRFDLV